MLSLNRTFLALSIRPLHSSSVVNSIFMKKQKKMDPEIAKQREARRRKKLEKEIRAMQKHSKKPKPVDEMTLDVRSSKNIQERKRTPVVYSEEEQDEFAIAMKDYTRSRNELQRIDDKWIRQSIAMQTKALKELKKLDPELYEKAVDPDTHLPLVSAGPALTAPVKGYKAPDGDYIDTTRTWT